MCFGLCVNSPSQATWTPPPVCVSRMHLTHFGAETHPPRSVSVLSPGGVFQTRGVKDTMASPMPPAPRLLACWFFDVWFLVIFLFNFPAEMRVGSLVSGCLFSDHFLPIAVILYTDIVICGASNLSFGDLVSPFWHPGGASSDPGALGSKRSETLGRQNLWHIRIYVLTSVHFHTPYCW